MLPRVPVAKWANHLAFAVLISLLLFHCPLLRGNGPVATITFILRDAKTTKPIPNVSILLVTWDERGAARKLGQAVTQKNGAAVFSISQQLPDRIGVSYSPDEVKTCSDLAFSTREILSMGVVAKNNCDTAGPKPTVLAKAGELIAFGSKISLAEKLRREIP